MEPNTRAAADSAAEPRAPQAIGRYWIYDEIAAGGMATVHLGRLVGPAGFTRTVAIKRLHAQFAKDDEFSSMFLDEARIAARIRHPNALTALDVVAAKGELYIIMDYIHGESLGKLLRAGAVPPAVSSSICTQALLGLHAAHEAVDDQGKPLKIVHRDVSPQNVLVGVDGVARVVDFGIAKAASRIHTTQAGKIKGKLSYMSPQQVSSEDIDRRADIFAAGVVLWESLVGRKLLARGDATIHRVMGWQGIPEEDLVLVPEAVRPILKRALARDVNARYPTAREMALALAEALPPASSMEVGDWVEQRAHQILTDRARAVSDVERQTTASDVRAAFSSQFPSAAASADETRTALSSASIDAPVSVRPNRGRRWGIAAALLLLLLGGGAYGLFGRAEPRPAVGAATPTPPAPLPPKTAEPVVPVAAPMPVTPPPAPVAEPAPEPTSPVSGAPRHRGAAPKPAPTPAPAPVAAPTPKKNCTPPFTIGADGIKHFKPECF